MTIKAKSKHSGHWAMCKHCERLARKFEREGMDTSDAQGAAMAEHMQAERAVAPFVDVSTETCNGVTLTLSQAVRVF